MYIYRRGDTISKWLKLSYKGTGEPVNLAGLNVFSQMRKEPDGDLIADGSVMVDAANGLICAVYTTEQSANLTPGEYGFDIRAKFVYQNQGRPDMDGNTPTVVTGNASVSEVITLFSTRITIVEPYTKNLG